MFPFQTTKKPKKDILDSFITDAVVCEQDDKPGYVVEWPSI